MKRFSHNFILIFGFDIILVAFSWYFAHLLRFNFSIPNPYYFLLRHVFPLVIIVKVLCFYFFNLYQGMWRYTSLMDLLNILKAVSLSSFIVLFMVVQSFSTYSFSIIIIDWFLTLILISGSRAGIRIFLWLYDGDMPLMSMIKAFFHYPYAQKEQRTKLMIIGAGDCGEKIFREIRDNSHLGYEVVGFIDDDFSKANLQIHGVPVLGNTNEIKYYVKMTGAEELLIAMPSASSKEIRNLVSRCDETGTTCKIVPGMGELIDGKVTVKAIRDVAYNDLLGRESVNLDEKLIGEYLKGKRIMITGAGGSIGSELCRQVCRFSPEAIILYERAESPLYEIDMELKGQFKYVRIVPRLADILDPLQLEKAFEQENPHVVFHAAAYKHVPMLEINPWRAIINNVKGTRNLIEVSRKFQVERFVLVSTDKAVRPTNVMGASKRLAEILTLSQNNQCLSTDTRFMAVRFGNVVGSVGSVVPLFKKQIEKGGPVTVTHPDMTRYFMTIPEACQLILQAGSMGNGGEIFILEMGVPIKIADMARDLIRLSGFEPDEDIKLEFVGLRPGEKIHEELITEGEGIVPTDHEKIMVLKGEVSDEIILNGKFDQLMDEALKQDRDGIVNTLKEMLKEYSPLSENTPNQ